MTSFAFSEKSVGKHTQVTIFAGADGEHRAYCGTLTFERHEAEDFVHGLLQIAVPRVGWCRPRST